MKRALIVGINYVGTGNDLRGCINDANNMQALLASRGFTEIKMLLEKEATTAKMKAALEWLVAGTAPGDVIVFHYSGHGSQLPSKVEADGYEEVLCPIDLNWTTRVIKDDDLRRVFDKVPNGCNVTLVLDCCHSGTALDQDETLAEEDSKEIAGDPSEDADSRYLEPPPKILEQLEDTELVEWSTSRDVNATAMLIAGCRAEQTSADALIDGMYQGAATAAILKIVKATPKVTYKNLVRRMTDYMVKNGYTQRPQLDGFSGLHPEIFAEPFGSADAVEDAVADVAVPAPAPAPTPAPTPAEPVRPEPPVGTVVQEGGSSNMILYVVIATVLLTAFLVFL